ncbi:STOML2 [Symbiodinium natans]|uniref:STOML2 protein n=1 Tax=Symbiodinium natans TaxID=878477 RepID=A0A812L040_9DINO|nr:STOML2 [Symbiodinium natans]
MPTTHLSQLQTRLPNSERRRPPIDPPKPETFSTPRQQTSSYPGYSSAQQAATPSTQQAHAGYGPGQGQVVPAQVPPRGTAGAAEDVVGNVAHIAVTGCTHSTVGGIVRGNFTANGQNHGRPTYKKDQQVNGLDVQLYYWDDRDGPNFCGWWFGPKVGGDQVWAYHPSSSAGTPPRTGWKVPYDGPADPTFVISPSQPGAAAAGGATAATGQGAQSQQQAAQALQQQYAAYTQQLQQQQAAYMQHYAQQAEQLKQQQEQMIAAQQKAMAMAAMKSKQEEMKVKQQEEMKRKAAEHQRMMEERQKQAEEQRAAMKIRQYMQKVRLSTEENLAQHHQELADVMQEELIKCGLQAPKVKEECDQAVEQAKTRIQAMKEAKRREEERKEEMAKQAREAQEKATELLKDLAAKVKEAEKAVDVLVSAAEPLKPEADLKLDVVNKLATAVQGKVGTAEEAIKECQDFVKEHSAAMRLSAVKRVTPGEETGDEPESLQAVVGKLNEITTKKDLTQKTASVAQERLKRKAAAKKLVDAELAKFAKFDVDKDGLLSKKELIAYAKKDASVTITDAKATQILKGIGSEGVKGGGVGVKKADFHRLKVQVGIAREKLKDAERRKQREAHEKELEGMKEGLKEKVAELDTKYTAVEEKVKAVEESAGPLANAQTMSSTELEPLLNKVEEQVTEAKEAVTEFKTQEVAEAKKGVEKELSAWFMMECRPVDSKTAVLDARLSNLSARLAKHRYDAKGKAAQEIVQLEKRALAGLRLHQHAKALSCDDLFKAMAGEKESLEKSDFVSFCANCEKADGEAVSEEDLSRVFDTLAAEAEAIEKDRMTAIIRCFKKVVKETVLTSDKSVKGDSIRRLLAGEVLEIMSAEVADEEAGVSRVRCHALKDGAEGWVTTSGNNGTPFLQDYTGVYKVVKETILTVAFELDSSGGKEAPRKLRPGDVVDVLIWPKKDKTGLMRLKCKCRTDGSVGWVTAVGNTGTTFLEVM